MRALLLLCLAAAALACVAAAPVIVSQWSDLGTLPKAPTHFKKATIVSEEELAKYTPPAPQPRQLPHWAQPQLGLQQPTLTPFPAPVPAPPAPAAPVAPVAPVAPAAEPAAPAAPATPAPVSVNPSTLVDAPGALDLEALEEERRWALARDELDAINRAEDEAADAIAAEPTQAGLPTVASAGTRCGTNGVCQRTSTSCNGTWQSGLCPGAADIRCCLPPATSSSNSAKRDQFLALIRSKLGSRNVRGGMGPSEFDCSGLVYWAARQVGITLPRVAHDQFSAGRAVNSIAERQPGDLIFFGKPGQRIYHVGVYVAPNMMINAPNSRSVVRQENYTYWPDRITQARRIF